MLRMGTHCPDAPRPRRIAPVVLILHEMRKIAPLKAAAQPFDDLWPCRLDCRAAFFRLPTPDSQLPAPNPQSPIPNPRPCYSRAFFKYFSSSAGT